MVVDLGNIGDGNSGTRSAIGGSDNSITPSSEEISILEDGSEENGGMDDPDETGTDIPPRRGPETDRGKGKKVKDDDTDDESGTDGDDGDSEEDDDETEDPDETEESEEASDDNAIEDPDGEVDGEDDGEGKGISFKDLNADYPGIFKKYPDLRTALAHSHAVGQLFPTRKDATIAAQKAETYDAINARLEKGEAKDFVEVFAQNKETFSQFSENFLSEVRKVNPELFKTLVTPSIKQVVLNSILEAKANNNVPLFKSAKNMAVYLFGKNWQQELQKQPEKKESKEPKEDPEKVELQEKLAKFENEKRTSFLRTVTANTDKEIGKVANQLFRKFDPEGKKLSERVRKTLTSEARDSIANKLRANPEYMRQFKSLMDKAKKAGFDSGLEPSVRNAYLGRAKNLFPTILQQLIADELGIKTPKQDKQRKVPQTGNVSRDRKEVAPHPDKVFKGENAKTELEFLSE